MTTLSFGYSTCPNDTFIFGNIASGKVTVPGVDFSITLADVEELNRSVHATRASGCPDVCKVSVAAAAGILDRYWLLRAGGAMGYGVGPLLVASEDVDISTLDSKSIAVPGRMTTATLLLELMLREAGVTASYDEMIFDAVMDALLNGSSKAGVIIHEGRFTYQDRGLVKLADLGAWWEESRGLPIPLGSIAIKRSLGLETAKRVGKAIRASLKLAREDESSVWSYIKQHAQEMEDEVVREHIRTFVTDYSMDVGTDGEKAITAILKEACLAGDRELPEQPLFVPAD